jgi:hypothetical protein
VPLLNNTPPYTLFIICNSTVSFLIGGSCSFGGGHEFLLVSASLNFDRAQVWFSDYKAAMKEIRPSEVNCSLLNYGIRSLVLVFSKRLGKVNQFMDISAKL